jgi:thiamine pyrophosphokinase
MRAPKLLVGSKSSYVPQICKGNTGLSPPVSVGDLDSVPGQADMQYKPHVNASQA